MAKLSARGRTEIFRMSRISENGAENHIVLCSDGVILAKYKYPRDIGGSTGWGRVSKATALTPEKIAEIRKHYSDQGYK
jgi:hypothetical protein